MGNITTTGSSASPTSVSLGRRQVSPYRAILSRHQREEDAAANSDQDDDDDEDSNVPATTRAAADESPRLIIPSSMLSASNIKKHTWTVLIAKTIHLSDDTKPFDVFDLEMPIPSVIRSSSARAYTLINLDVCDFSVHCPSHAVCFRLDGVPSKNTLCLSNGTELNCFTILALDDNRKADSPVINAYAGEEELTVPLHHLSTIMRYETLKDALPELVTDAGGDPQITVTPYMEELIQRNNLPRDALSSRHYNVVRERVQREIYDACQHLVHCKNLSAKLQLLAKRATRPVLRYPSNNDKEVDEIFVQATIRMTALHGADYEWKR